jgi:hypothetical protein
MTTVGLPPGMTGAAVPSASPPVRVKILVKTVGGSDQEVATPEEKTFFEAIRDLYLKQNAFTAVTDLQDLDRLLGLELVDFRFRQWIGAGRDYSGALVDEVQLARQHKDISAQITAVKSSMGLSKAERDKDSFDTVGAYVTRLKHAAKAFGVHRNNQAAKAIALLQEGLGMARTWQRSNEFERKKIGLDPETIVEWFLTVAGPEFDELDRVFRAGTQVYFQID